MNSGVGRITVNAGKSESYGAEISLTATPDRHWLLNGSYGYTHATFKEYDGGIGSNEQAIDYSGNHVPFVPMHTLNIGAAYTFFLNGSWAESLTLGATCTGAGKIYWTEANDASQDFYSTLGARASLKAKALQIDLWGRNLTDTNYTTFHFESMDRGFSQKCKPLQVGVDVKWHF